MGEVEIDSPRDRDGSFEPQLIPKRSKDVSGIEEIVLCIPLCGLPVCKHTKRYGNKKLCRIRSFRV